MTVYGRKKEKDKNIIGPLYCLDAKYIIAVLHIGWVPLVIQN